MVFVECKADLTHIKNIGIRLNEIYHAGDKGRVCKNLRKKENVCGMVDEDPLSSQPSYLKEIRFIKEIEGIKYFKDEKRKNNVVILSPYLEEWILKIVKKYKIKIKEYGLPGESRKFHKIVNSNIEKLENLLEELKEKEEFIFLKTILKREI
ncbi:hypothetical protein J7K25_03870 [bacterium]|nr:hypothetical protein [bacterium]